MKEHISYSEFACWTACAWKHKKKYIEQIEIPFPMPEYAPFGTAIHATLERLLQDRKLITDSAGRIGEKEILLNEEAPKYFKTLFQHEIKELLKKHSNLNKKLLVEMFKQGEEILAETLKAIYDHFGYDFEVVSVETKLYEPIKEYNINKKFKGFIDLVLKTADGKIHIIDWKTCSWGWDAKKKSDKIIGYQLVFYKKFFAEAFNIDIKNIETYFALLKRTAKVGKKVEIFKITSGNKKITNAVNMLENAMYNIDNNKLPIKNRLSCQYCEYYQTVHCP